MKITCFYADKRLTIHTPLLELTNSYLKKFQVPTEKDSLRDNKSIHLFVQSIYSQEKLAKSHTTIFHGPLISSEKKPYSFSSLAFSCQNVGIISYPDKGQMKIQPTTEDFLAYKTASIAKEILEGKQDRKLNLFIGSEPISLRDFLKKTLPETTSDVIELSMPIKALKTSAKEIDQGLLREEVIEKLLDNQSLYPSIGPCSDEVAKTLPINGPIDLLRNLYYFQNPENQDQLHFLKKLLEQSTFDLKS